MDFTMMFKKTLLRCFARATRDVLTSVENVSEILERRI